MVSTRLLIFFVLISSRSLLAIDPDCRSEIADLASGLLTKLKVSQRAFVDQILIPTVGLRALYEAPDRIRTHQVDANSLVLRGFSKSLNLRFEWTDKVQNPIVEETKEELILKLPKRPLTGEKEIESFQNTLRRMLVGHSLHPFDAPPDVRAERLALGEPELFLKEAQKEGIAAAQMAMDRFHSDDGPNKFLYVAPTGTGKTEVLTTVLENRIRHSDKKLHILAADQNFLVDQLTRDMSQLQSRMKEDRPFRIIQWGGDFGSQDIDELMRIVESSDEPIVLTTTIQSLKSRVNSENAENNLKMLRGVLSTIAYDEAHHTGAEQAQELLRELIDHEDSEAFLYGTTATPIHAEAEINQIFDGQAFWAYLDKAKDFIEHGGAFERSPEEVIEQLSRAIQRGELSPFERVYFLDPETAFQLPAGESLFERAGLGIKKEYYPQLARLLEPLFRKHKRGFLAVSSIPEANAIAKFLSKQFPSRKFAALHSETIDDDKIKSDFKEGRIDFLVTVRRLDEGMNFPDLSLYIDLNRTIGPRQFLQRVGRILRIVTGKMGVDVVTLMDIQEDSLRTLISFVNRVFSGELRVPPNLTERPTPFNDEAPSDPMGISFDETKYKEGLQTLIKNLKDFWSEATQAESGVELLNQFVARTGKLPSETDKDGPLAFAALKKVMTLLERNSMSSRGLQKLSKEVIQQIAGKYPDLQIVELIREANKHFQNATSSNSDVIEWNPNEMIRDLFFDVAKHPFVAALAHPKLIDWLERHGAIELRDETALKTIVDWLTDPHDLPLLKAARNYSPTAVRYNEAMKPVRKFARDPSFQAKLDQKLPGVGQALAKAARYRNNAAGMNLYVKVRRAQGWTDAKIESEILSKPQLSSTVLAISKFDHIDEDVQPLMTRLAEKLRLQKEAKVNDRISQRLIEYHEKAATKALRLHPFSLNPFEVAMAVVHARDPSIKPEDLMSAIEPIAHQLDVIAEEARRLSKQIEVSLSIPNEQLKTALSESSKLISQALKLATKEGIPFELLPEDLKDLHRDFNHKLKERRTYILPYADQSKLVIFSNGVLDEELNSWQNAISKLPSFESIQDWALTQINWSSPEGNGGLSLASFKQALKKFSFSESDFNLKQNVVRRALEVRIPPTDHLNTYYMSLLHLEFRSTQLHTPGRELWRNREFIRVWIQVLRDLKRYTEAAGLPPSLPQLSKLYLGLQALQMHLAGNSKDSALLTVEEHEFLKASLERESTADFQNWLKESDAQAPSNAQTKNESKAPAIDLSSYNPASASRLNREIVARGLYKEPHFKEIILTLISKDPLAASALLEFPELVSHFEIQDTELWISWIVKCAEADPSVKDFVEHPLLRKALGLPTE